MTEPVPPNPLFAARTAIEQVEEGLDLAPRFDAEGLIPVITTDAADGMVLMHGYMDAEAVERTLKTGQAHYWSRSRRALWRKGEHSGLIKDVVQIRIDDDQDAIWLQVTVRGSGASCHVGYRSCFYRAVESPPGAAGPAQLSFVAAGKLFDPHETYGDAPNPTQL